MRGDGRGIVADDIAQHRLGIPAEHGKFPTARQLGVGEMQRKIRQHDLAQSRIFHLDDEAALLELRVVDQILAGLHDAAGNPRFLQLIADREGVLRLASMLR